MKKTKEEIARAAIASSAERWEDSSDAVMSMVDEEPVFTFYAHSESGTSTFVFNPLPVVLDIVDEILSQLTTSNGDMIDDLLYLNVAGATDWLLHVVAKQHFETFLNELPLVAITAKSASALEAFGAKKKREEEIERMVKTFGDRLRRKFGPPPSGKQAAYVITDFHVVSVVENALHTKKKSPSEIQVARHIFQTHPGRWNNERGAKSALRKWRADRNLKTWKEALEAVQRAIEQREVTRRKLESEVRAKRK